MTETWDPKICLDRALRADTAPAELARLSRSDHVFVREAAARHTSTPEPALLAMTPIALETEDDFRVAAALLTNPEAPKSVCERIAAAARAAVSHFLPREYYPRVMLDALAANQYAGPMVLGALLDPDRSPRHVREWIVRSTTRDDVLEALVGDVSSNVSSRARRLLESRRA